MPIISVSGTFWIMRTLLRIRAHSTEILPGKWWTKITYHLLLQNRLYEPVVLHFGFCCFGDMLFKQTLGNICFPKRRASQYQTRLQVKFRDSKHAPWSAMLSLSPCPTCNRDPEDPRESNILRLCIIFHTLLAVKPQANHLAFLSLCVLDCKTEWQKHYPRCRVVMRSKWEFVRNSVKLAKAFINSIITQKRFSVLLLGEYVSSEGREGILTPTMCGVMNRDSLHLFPPCLRRCKR